MTVIRSGRGRPTLDRFTRGLLLVAFDDHGALARGARHIDGKEVVNVLPRTAPGKGAAFAGAVKEALMELLVLRPQTVVARRQ